MLRHITDLLFPRRCLICGTPLPVSSELLCVTCLAHAPYIMHQSFTDNEMCRVFWHLLPIQRASAMFRYAAHSQWHALVTAGKFGSRQDVMLSVGHMMGRHFMHRHFFDGIDAIVPMPTPSAHIRKRGYDHALLLAQGVARATGLPLMDNLVCRRRANGRQAMRTRLERLVYMRQQFALTASASQAEGLHLVLIDDVCTTGASLTALGETLMGVPGIKLSVLTVMRTAYA